MRAQVDHECREFTVCPQPDKVTRQVTHRTFVLSVNLLKILAKYEFKEYESTLIFLEGHFSVPTSILNRLGSLDKHRLSFGV